MASDQTMATRSAQRPRGPLRGTEGLESAYQLPPTQADTPSNPAGGTKVIWNWGEASDMEKGRSQCQVSRHKQNSGKATRESPYHTQVGPKDPELVGVGSVLEAGGDTWIPEAWAGPLDFLASLARPRQQGRKTYPQQQTPLIHGGAVRVTVQGNNGSFSAVQPCAGD